VPSVLLQFGSSSQAVFFKMRVAGVLHIFQFETRQGEDICMALQTHINDIMMKRYSKVRRLQPASLIPYNNSTICMRPICCVVDRHHWLGSSMLCTLRQLCNMLTILCYVTTQLAISL
jgi:hypothetical protein